MRIIAIAAVADNGVIGSGHGMLWHLPGDFKRFKRVTMGHTLVLGRRTFEEIGLLPGRRTVVVTRDPGWSHDGVDAVRSVPEALALAAARGADRVFIGGGSELYQSAMPWVTELDLTRVAQSPDGAARFPAIDPDQWTRVSSVRMPEGYSFTYWLPRVICEIASRDPNALGLAGLGERLPAE